MKTARLKAKMTQEQLAATMGVSRKFVCSLEIGKVQLPVSQLATVAKALDVNIHDIMLWSCGKNVKRIYDAILSVD